MKTEQPVRVSVVGLQYVVLRTAGAVFIAKAVGASVTVTSMKYPIAVLIVAGIYLLVGVAGFIYHFPELTAGHRDAIAIELTELVAFVCGVFLLLRHNWARWLALAWVVFHVIISFFHPLRELAIHAILCILIAWALFRPATTRWFQRANSGS